MSKDLKPIETEDVLPVNGTNDTPGEQDGNYLDANTENVKDAIDELNNVGPEGDD